MIFVFDAFFTRVNTKTRRHQIVITEAFTLTELERAVRIHSARTLDEISSSNNDQHLRATILEKLHDFLPLFKKKLADTLPPHRLYDHKISLKEGFTPPFGPLYKMSRNELQVAWEWLQKNLSKGFVRASSSSEEAPILFAKKKDGSLRFCIDYRELNEDTIKNRYSLSLINETLARLFKARFFTKLDVRDVFNLLRVVDEDVWKTAFRTR
jgi:hypothetical protein